MSMSKETELRTFSRLAAGEQLAWGSVPKSVKNGPSLSELLATGVLTKVRRGAGQVLIVADPDALESFLDSRFPGRHSAAAGDGIGNVKRYRDSKGGKKESIGIVLLRGWQTISVNDEQVDLTYFTQHFSSFSVVKPQLKAKKLCLVENLDTFVEAEGLLGKDWIFAHTYGRLGLKTLAGLEAEEILHFGDWDFTGLDEYLRLREQFPQTQLYLPDNLEALWATSSKPLKKGAVITKRLKDSDDPGVVRVLSLLSTTNKFLEQQAVFPSPNPVR
jgi:hypothetical protein